MSTVPFVFTEIRRDTFNTVCTMVPAHEFPIIQAIFGEESVTVGDKSGEYVFEDALELERIARKYGAARLAESLGKTWPAQVKAAIKENAVKARKAAA